MTRIKTQYDLMAAVVDKLAGQPVELLLETPKGHSDRGRVTATAHIGPDGPVITIEPGRPDMDLLESLLHEAAHIRLGHIRRRLDLSGVKPRAIRLQDSGARYDKQEHQVEAHVSHWLAYARAHANDPNDFESLLWALYRKDK